LKDPKLFRAEEVPAEEKAPKHDAININDVAEIDESIRQKMMDKYDTDSATRTLTGVPHLIVKYVAICMACYHIYTAMFGMPETLVHRAIHIAFIFPLLFLLYAETKEGKRKNPVIIDYIFAVMGAAPCIYLVINYREICKRGIANQMDVIMAVILCVAILLATRRAVGWQLVIVACVFLAYCYFGKYMPGIFMHKGATLKRMTAHMFLIPEGFFSVAVGTSATYITLFVIFAAFLERSGMSGFIKDIAIALAGGAVGGPAKVSVVSSAAFGTISGSAAANVVTTGAFTIPLMKSTGYEPEFAGAVEAVASTGGQLMPPIMGSAAFIMADYLGISYFTIIKAALIPVFLYYLSVFIMVDLRARKLGLKGISRENLPSAKKVLKERGHLMIPFILVILLLVMGRTPMFCGTAGIIATVICAALRKETRMGFKDIVWSLENGAKRCISVAMSCAVVGCVIGVCTLTGISTILGNYILQISAGNLILTLILVAIIAIIMGMGIPTVAVYILLTSVAVPILIAMEIPALCAHFFVFYFGIIANVTPPVAIPAYAAAGLANSNPSKTGWAAFKIALPSFLIPFLFIYSPHMLMVDATIIQWLYSALSPTIGVVCICFAVEGYMLGKIAVWKRVLLLASGCLLIKYGIVTDLIGLGSFALVFLLQRRKETKVSVKSH